MELCAAETIENNIRKKVVERITINPAYYAKMSEVLEQLILERRRGVLAYQELLARYVELATNVAKPEDNTRYPESIRASGALRALYDNCGEDEELAIRLDKAIRARKQDGFRNNPVKENRIKQELYKVLGDEDEVEYSNRGNALELSGDRAILTVRKESTPQQRENYVNEWYRERLKAEIEKRLPKWETLTGLHCSSWQTKYMTTNWGTCNTKTGKIWINLQLAKKPFECLDYVLLHELAHLRVKDHGAAFTAILDEFMPYWREIKKELNDSALDYLPNSR